MKKSNQKKVSEVDAELLQARRLQTLKRLDQIGVWDCIETPEQATNMMDVVKKVATGEVSSENVMALLKGK